MHLMSLAAAVNCWLIYTIQNLNILKDFQFEKRIKHYRCMPVQLMSPPCYPLKSSLHVELCESFNNAEYLNIKSPKRVMNALWINFMKLTSTFIVMLTFKHSLLLYPISDYWKTKYSFFFNIGNFLSTQGKPCQPTINNPKFVLDKLAFQSRTKLNFLFYILYLTVEKLHFKHFWFTALFNFFVTILSIKNYSRYVASFSGEKTFLFHSIFDISNLYLSLSSLRTRNSISSHGWIQITANHTRAKPQKVRNFFHNQNSTPQKNCSD